MSRQRPRTLAVLTEWAAERYGGAPALRFRSHDGGGDGGGGGGWTDVGYTALRESVRAVGRGLLALGVRPDDRVAILAETRPEWTHAYYGALAAGAVIVPVYPTAGEEELAWVLADSAASVVICEDAAQAERVAAVRAKLPELRHVVLMEGGGGGDAPAPGEGGSDASVPGGGGSDASTQGMGGRDASGPRASAPPAGGGDAIAPGAPGRDTLVLGALPRSVPAEELLARAAARRPEDVCSIVYTSGTTGPPKGCRLTHGNHAVVDDASAELLGSEEGDVLYLYLPLAHVFAQLAQLSALVQGRTLCYFGGSVQRVVAELAEVAPTHLPSVPRLFEKVYAGALSVAEARGAGERARFDEAIRTGLEVAELRARGAEPGGALLAAWKTADEELFGHVRAAFGGRLRVAITGAAPIAPRAMEFLRACGITVFEGYGMTESSGVITLSHPGGLRAGTVGRPVDCCEVRIAEDGEVLARGPGIFAGYHGAPEATAEVLDPDGWLHTGDVGAFDGDGFLKITGRKKDLVITSGGKNLAPAPVEFALQQSRWISRAIMIGDKRPYPVALLTLDAEEIAAWAVREGLPPLARPAQHPTVRELCREAVDMANEQLSGPARIRAFAIIDDDFTVADGSLTPTLKVRRAVIAERYASEIDALYQHHSVRSEK
ncbi:AMP-dependent synthetase [Streptomyces eurocidicus]|uniref:Acyl-CoA synthetase n=1 Tax=Streptomyces eurocidicus TaxID=66423 RepID=A0A2N8NS19_STREU|nr:long-chain fatty acid--CoA ligase [Streptomyces eurocidicus]MBB5122812.1 long-chain acyl-CoA synthetase [Streptomyces eurocidicus]MBF6054319.1 AMP-binding protein [Streptomyces eurocidicus]PNE31558.1 AMP-dependent synthetase [Streptomyces eurocidicus]